MVAFNNVIQKRTQTNGLRIETGAGVTIAGVSGQTFTVATKLRKVISGIGVMETDGIPVVATTGNVSGGQVTFTRLAPITTSADTISYTLKGW